MTLIRWNPTRDMMNLRREMDRLFNDFMTDTPGNRFETPSWGLALDVAENDNSFVVKASVPGVEPDDLDVTINENTLTIRGEVHVDETFDEGQYHVRERRFGTFSRSMTLPRTVDREAIDADYHNGVLTLTLPKTEDLQPRKISIKANGSKNIIEASANGS